MKKINTSPISGMQELLPPQQAVFNQLKAQIETVYRQHGFQNVETPIIDRTDILLAKAGGDTEKQIYKVVKTKEASEGADQALRFDHTVPLARYIIEHENDLTFPFKVSQIGRNFRGERAQKGRFREFYQCDVDVIGRAGLPVSYDAEVILTIYQALETFQLPQMMVRISNRKILTGFLEELGLTEHTEAILGIIDHAEKVPEKVTISHLQGLGIGNGNVDKVLTLMQINGPRAEAVEKLQALSIKNETFAAGVDELDQVLSSLEASRLTNVTVDLLIVRGLDYYTGTVFETFLTEHKDIGSIASGGRYDNLTNFFSEHPFPGVGGSIGLTRLFYVLNENNLLKSQITAPVDVAVIPMSAAEEPAAHELAEKLRAQGKSVDIVLTDKKLGDKLNYAGKVASYAVVVGENEVKTGDYKVKNLNTRQEVSLAEYL